MKYLLPIVVFLLNACFVQAQSRFPKSQISVNAFRNPSIGLEYQKKQLAIHGGYYFTNLQSGITTEFLKAGVTYFFLPWGKQEIPSSLYIGSSYLRGLTKAYKKQNAVAFEAGARFMVWKGLNLRIGAIALVADGKSVKVNPAPGINYSFHF